MGSNDERISVGIIGGGIAGLSLAIGLLKTDIAVTVYESAKNFGEIGAGVVFHPNAVRAMDGIDPRITSGFEKVANTNAFPELKDVYFDYRVGEGENAGQLIARPKCPGPHGGAHRAKFLEELIKILPSDVSRFGKRLVSMSSEGDKTRLTFKDGTEAEHNCIIGADGIHSEVRKFVLGHEDPAAIPVFSGSYCHRGLIPMEQAVEALGEEMAMNCQSHLGHGAHLLTFPVNEHKTFNAVAFSTCETWDHENWVVAGHLKNISQNFQNFGRHVQEVIKRMQHTDIWALFEHLPASTFCKGNVAVIGDAAHSTTPYQGNGAGFAMEDAYVLSSLLARVRQADEIERCLAAFDAVRRERGLKLVRTSKEAGLLWNMKDPDASDDLDSIRKSALTRWEWIWAVDHEADIQKGLQLMDVL